MRLCGHTTMNNDRELWDYLPLAWSMRRDLPDGAAETLADLRLEWKEDVDGGRHPDLEGIRNDLADWAEEWGLPGPP